MDSVVEGEAGTVDGLDDAVVQLAPDALALLDRRQPLDLPIEAGVLDGDGGLSSEGDHGRLVLLGELWPGQLIGQVEVADGPSPGDDRHAQEAVHRGVIGAEAGRAGVVSQVGQPDRSGVLDQGAEQPAAARQVMDQRLLLGRHAAGDELVQVAVAVEHAQGGVAGPGQGARLVGDALEDRLEREVGGEAHAGRVERLEGAVLVEDALLLGLKAAEDPDREDQDAGQHDRGADQVGGQAREAGLD